jgi:transcriptional regulator
MYAPAHYREDEPARLYPFIERHPFATLVTTAGGRPEANHVPVLLDRSRGTLGVLQGHVARANPVWKSGESDVLAIFHGADAYVSPSAYPAKQVDGRVVPTWNYAVVHARGRIRWFDDPPSLHRLVSALTLRHESSRSAPWAVSDAPVAYVEAMLRGIVGFEVEIVELAGKFKASQNKPATDRAGVRAELTASVDAAQLDELVRDPVPPG